MSPSLLERPDLERSTLRAVAWRLIPFICLLYFLNILDRTNVGVARLKMQDDLGLSKAVFDFGAGIFYAGYILFEVPSNLIMRRVGARRWIARIMISWGCVTALTLFASGMWSFYAFRILLGVAEAGFFPGIILYLSFWIPDRERARMTAFFMTASAMSGVLGTPISGFIQTYLHEVGGLRGWQWLFLLEGLPSILVGFCVLWYLTDYPRDASWLPEDQRQWLMERMEREEEHRRQSPGSDRMAALMQGRVWLLIAIYFTVAVGTNASSAYLPGLIKDRFTTLSDFQVTLLGALPHLCAVVSMTLFGISSDRRKERRGHLAAAALLGGMGWTIAAGTSNPALALAGLCIAQAGMMSMLPVFWTVPTTFLSGAAAAGGIALINSVANIGGLLGPSILGEGGLWAMAGILTAGAVLATRIQPGPAAGETVQGVERHEKVAV